MSRSEAIGVVQVNLPSIVASSRDVIDGTGKFEAKGTGHGKTIRQNRYKVKA